MSEVTEVPEVAVSAQTDETRRVVEKVDSAAAWKNRSQRTITLPSGTQVDIVLPNINEMAAAGDIPNPLIEAAANKIEGVPVKPSQDALKKQAEFNRYMIAKMVKYPTIAEGDVADLPADDTDLLQKIAFRETDFDAVGEHISGLDTVASFRRFRLLDE